MESIDVMLKEYEALRAEILVTMNARISVLSFGLATIGLIFTASVAASVSGSNPVPDNNPLPGVMLILAVPAITDFVLFIWLGEYQRMQRAGRFLVDLEHRINDKAKENLLTWETQLRNQRSHMKYPYNTTVMLLIAISLISLVMGLITFGPPQTWIWVVCIVGIVVHLVVYGYAVSRIRKLAS